MKPTRIFTKALFFVLLSIAFAGCSKDKEDVSTDIKEIQLSSSTTEASFKITSSGEWYIEADGLDYMYGGNRGSTDWYCITPAGGTGDATVTVTLREGITATEKSTTLKIIGKDNTEFVKLNYIK
jgi:hypothetical protein